MKQTNKHLKMKNKKSK